jgi:hypothetical protein
VAQVRRPGSPVVVNNRPVHLLVLAGWDVGPFDTDGRGGFGTAVERGPVTTFSPNATWATSPCVYLDMTDAAAALLSAVSGNTGGSIPGMAVDRATEATRTFEYNSMRSGHVRCASQWLIYP